MRTCIDKGKNCAVSAIRKERLRKEATMSME
jgi:hypothetical protein